MKLSDVIKLIEGWREECANNSNLYASEMTVHDSNIACDIYDDVLALLSKVTVEKVRCERCSWQQDGEAECSGMTAYPECNLPEIREWQREYALFGSELMELVDMFGCKHFKKEK